MKPSQSRLLRDLVEVGAIVIAGIWAFYVFAYQNVIVPNFANPTPSFTVAMRHVGNDGDFAVVRIDESIRNIGTVPVQFIAHSLTVLGMNVAPGAAQRATSDGVYYAYSHFTKSQVIFQNTIVTSLGDPKQSAQILVAPGTVTTLSRELYVPKNRFGRLVVWLVAGYSKEDKPVATTVSMAPSGVPRFQYAGNDIYVTASPVAELDLKAE